MTSGQKTGLAIALALGSVAAIGGTIALATRKKTRTSSTLADSHAFGRSNALPKRVQTVKRGGMRLDAYEQPSMTIQERVALLQDLVAKGVTDPRMRKLALEITRECPPRDGECEARSIYAWMRQNVRYTGDIGPHVRRRGQAAEPVDLFQLGKRTVEFGGGDCDDHSVLGATLAAHNGFHTRFRITAPSSAKNVDDWSHIYLMIGLPKDNPTRWVAVDTTIGRTGRENLFGVEVPFGKKIDFVA